MAKHLFLNGINMSKRKYLKVALPAHEYTALTLAADHRGLTLAAFVRSQLGERQKPITLEAQLSRIEAQIQRGHESSNSNEFSLKLFEVLLLVRELVAERNAQVLVRVRQKIDAMGVKEGT